MLSMLDHPGEGPEMLSPVPSAALTLRKGNSSDGHSLLMSLPSRIKLSATLLGPVGGYAQWVPGHAYIWLGEFRSGTQWPM